MMAATSPIRADGLKDAAMILASISSLTRLMASLVRQGSQAPSSLGRVIGFTVI